MLKIVGSEEERVVGFPSFVCAKGSVIDAVGHGIRVVVGGGAGGNVDCDVVINSVNIEGGGVVVVVMVVGAGGDSPVNDNVDEGGDVPRVYSEGSVDLIDFADVVVIGIAVVVDVTSIENIDKGSVGTGDIVVGNVVDNNDGKV